MLDIFDLKKEAACGFVLFSTTQEDRFLVSLTIPNVIFKCMGWGHKAKKSLNVETTEEYIDLSLYAKTEVAGVDEEHESMESCCLLYCCAVLPYRKFRSRC